MVFHTVNKFVDVKPIFLLLNILLQLFFHVNVIDKFNFVMKLQ